MYGTPRVPRGFIARRRLHAALETDAALVIVRGAAGGGKTVAVADWATGGSGAEQSGAWLTIDTGSTTRVALWHAVIELLTDAQLLPDGSILGRSLLSLDVAPDLRRLLRRGFAQVTDDVTIVLDDYHLVGEAVVHDDLIDVVRSSPRVRFIVLTRNRGPLEADDIRLAADTVLVSPDELSLTPDETAQMISLAGIEGDPSLAQAVWESVGGHPLLTRGVILATERSEAGFDVATLRGTLADTGARMLRETILRTAPSSDDLDFVLRCSIPEYLTAELAGALTDHSDAGRMLEECEASGIGLWSDGQAGTVFTLTPVSRSALRSELARRFPADVHRLHRITADWAARNGQPFQALMHALKADDLELASTVAMRDWYVLLSRHRQAIIDHVGALSLRKLNANPLLTMMLALGYNASGVHKLRAIEMFGVALVSAKMRGSREPVAKRLVLNVIESTALRLLGRTDAAVEAAVRAAALEEQLGIDERDELARIYPTLLAQCGLSLFYGGRREAALTFFRRAMAYPKLVSQSGWYHGLSLTAGALAGEGAMDEVASLLEIARKEHWPEGWRDGYIGALYHVAESYAALEEFDCARALHHVEVMAPHLQTIEHWPLYLNVSALAMLGQGRAPEALALLEGEPRRHSRSISRLTGIWVDCTRALALLAAGRVAEAGSLLKKHPKSVPSVAVGLARISLLGGRPELAVRNLADASWESGRSPRLHSEMLLVAAAATLRLGRTDVALAHLEEAAVLMRKRQLAFPLVTVPRDDLKALRNAAAARGMSAPAMLLSRVDELPAVFTEAVLLSPLTKRETVVLHQLVSTGNVAEIAATLYVSTNTVKTQLRSIYRKLDVGSRQDALIVASERRLIDP